MAARKKASAKTALVEETHPGLEAALARWRASRDPADAEDVVSAKDPAWSKLTASIARSGGDMDDVLKRMTSVRDIQDDPRLSNAIIDWLAEARWPGSGAADGWKAMLERLVSLRDARAIAPLRQMAKELPPFVGIKHRAFMAPLLADAADALEHAVPNARVPKPIPVKKPGAGRDTMAIVQRVFDSPDDDDLRRVVADELLETGDPWGEFIQLQFLIAEGNATPEQTKRAETLANKNAPTFLGPLAKIAKADSRGFEKGFATRILTNATMVGRPAWELAASSVYWSTMKRLELSPSSTPKWWVPELFKNPALKNLREIHVNRHFVPVISMKRETLDAPWRLVEAEPSFDRSFLRMFVSVLTSLPPAERDRVEVGPIEKRDQFVIVVDRARA